MRTIRINTATDVLQLTTTHTHQQILEMMSRPMMLPPVQAIMGQSLHGIGNVNSSTPTKVNGNPLAPIKLLGDQESPLNVKPSFHNGIQPQGLATPATNALETGMLHGSDGNENVYSEMQDRFDRGDFGVGSFQQGGFDHADSGYATAQQAIAAMTHDKRTAAALRTGADESEAMQTAEKPVDPKPTEPVQSKKRATAHPRCEACKSKRAKCYHIIDENGVRRTPSHEDGTAAAEVPATTASREPQAQAAQPQQLEWLLNTAANVPISDLSGGLAFNQMDFNINVSPDGRSKALCALSSADSMALAPMNNLQDNSMSAGGAHDAFRAEMAAASGQQTNSFIPNAGSPEPVAQLQQDKIVAAEHADGPNGKEGTTDAQHPPGKKRTSRPKKSRYHDEHSQGIPDVDDFYREQLDATSIPIQDMLKVARGGFAEEYGRGANGNRVLKWIAPKLW